MSRSDGCLRIQRLLEKAIVAFDNALASPEIMARLTAYSYDEARLLGCQERVATLRQLYKTQQSLRSDKAEATAAYQKARRKADRQHGELVRRARVLVHARPGLAQALRLRSKDSSRAYNNWSARQDQFYSEVADDEDLAGQLLVLGVTPEWLAEGRAAYQNTVDAYKAREDLNGLANQATEDRNAAEAEVRACLSQFRTIARVALADNPDWLKRLGLA
jgi:hypothetical protein